MDMFDDLRRMNKRQVILFLLRGPLLHFILLNFCLASVWLQTCNCKLHTNRGLGYCSLNLVLFLGQHKLGKQRKKTCPRTRHERCPDNEYMHVISRRWVFN